MSGLRFARHAHRTGKPLVVINRGITRADDIADWVRNRNRTFTHAPADLPREDPLVQQVIGRAAGAAYAARTLVLDIADQLLKEREEGQFPPFRAMAIFRAEGDTMEKSLQVLDTVKPLANTTGIETWGPLPAMIARRADKHRAQLILNARNRKKLNSLLTGICQELDQRKLPAGVKWMIDVDPQETG